MSILRLRQSKKEQIMSKRSYQTDREQNLAKTEELIKIANEFAAKGQYLEAIEYLKDANYLSPENNANIVSNLFALNLYLAIALDKNDLSEKAIIKYNESKKYSDKLKEIYKSSMPFTIEMEQTMEKIITHLDNQYEECGKINNMTAANRVLEYSVEYYQLKNEISSHIINVKRHELGYKAKSKSHFLQEKPSPSSKMTSEDNNINTPPQTQKPQARKMTEEMRIALDGAGNIDVGTINCLGELETIKVASEKYDDWD